jgi:predicted molibdopterin-dependent oxidoreductase YjgC
MSSSGDFYSGISFFGFIIRTKQRRLDYHLWKNSSFCILCGLYARYCAEVKKKNAAGFVECGARREIRFIPEIATKDCKDCKECFALCPTSYLQAAFVLTESLAFSSDSSPTESTK